MTPDPSMPSHIEMTVRSISELHARHDQHTSAVQRVLAGVTRVMGSPMFLGGLTAAAMLWIAGNLIAAATGRTPWDAPPFAWLTAAASVLALYTTVLILVTQRHEDRLANHREQLTLELAILSEQKSAKIIELLEKLRRDSPNLANHDDAEATAMASSSDTVTILNAMHDAESMAGSPVRLVQAS